MLPVYELTQATGSWTVPWSMVNLPGITARRKVGCPPIDVSVDLQLRGGTHMPVPMHIGMWTGLQVQLAGNKTFNI